MFPSDQPGQVQLPDPNSPVIYRCAGCGGIVHPADPHSSLVAWCQRCRRYDDANVDGG